MTDVHNPVTRSRNMAAIKGKNTGPEILVRKALFSLGLRYRLHKKELQGKPDIVFVSKKVAIFVHGCFWHMHDCEKFKLPQSRKSFWLEKLQGNKNRDKKNIQELLDKGWRVIIVWECDIKKHQKDKNLNDLALRIKALLEPQSQHNILIDLIK